MTDKHSRLNAPYRKRPPLKNKRHYGHWLTFAVLAVALLVSYQLWRATQHNLEHERQIYFEFRVRQLLQSIEQRLQTYEQILYGARGLFAASQTIDRHEYREYVSSLNLDRRYPGIQGLGFSLFIPKAEKAGHVAEMRRQGFADYDIYPAGEREVYTSIIYLEPLSDRNLRALGYDMFSETARRQAMSFARDRNSLGMSAKVTLVRESEPDAQTGFLMYLPVYKIKQPHDTVEDRRAHLLGWVYAPFRSQDLMSGIGGERENDLRLEIFDGEQVDEEHRMYGSAPDQDAPPRLTSRQQVAIASHPWTVLIHAEPNFQTRVDQDKPLIVAGGGIGLGLLLTLLTWQLANGRGRALALAETMTSELRESESRFRAMADSAPVLIWISGPDKLCYWFNKVWLEFTGRGIEQEMGNGWAQAVHPDDLDFCLRHYTQHFDRRIPFRMEYRLKRHDGEYRWLLDNGIPRYADNGEFVGYIGSCIDITEHKQVLAALENSNADLSRFAEVAAHHLMEPTRRFTSFTQRLRAALSAYPDAVQDENIAASLQFLEQDALRLYNLVRDVQRYTAANQPLDKVGPTAAKPAAESAIRHLAAKIAASGAVVDLAELPPAYIDRPRLVELFSLLLDNALTHGRPHAPEQPLHIEIDGVSDRTISRYYVRDNGAGVGPEYRQRVFEIFERLSYDKRGTGIGLSIARRIVTSCHGGIWIENAAQGGTVAVFELPNVESDHHDA